MIKQALDPGPDNVFIPTKTCRISVLLKTGTRVTGQMHVPEDTRSSVRPSDAIRRCRDRFLLLTDVAVEAMPKDRHVPTMMIPPGAITLIELPETGWDSRRD